ncbi:MAG: NADP-specific glutamate dehydrogenase [Actinobacteria bacterium HGW-Actinobacteria-4]|nr:MAG: NADP-specific glutamate dehydrogenase [Actinobacteria bacterium HGW-Actinobacteria-4]
MSTSYVHDLMAHVRDFHPGETEFHQAVQEVAESVALVIDRHPEYAKAKVLERIIEPQRAILFGVPWVDDSGEVQINRGYRVQQNNAVGPYKGGTRFHPSVNLAVMKFLAFEQTFKNSLTALNMGGGKGGADFDPKGKSDAEIMRFCQSYMTELYRHLGPNVDVPAGDIGVGGREIGYLFGQYKRLSGEFTGTMTGKRLAWGGSKLRPEATGYGLVYFVEQMLEVRGERLDDKVCLVSGAGNVAQFTVEKLLDLGAKPVTMSDSGGFIYDPEGIDSDKLYWIQDLKNVRGGRIAEYADRYPRATFTPVDASLDHNPLWSTPADIALPCATQNEINAADAAHLIEGGVRLVAEGANMPSQADAVEAFHEAGIVFAPGKASNAGGVAVSGLEMAQNSSHSQWSRGEVDAKLHQIMKDIHRTCAERADEYGVPGNYVHGANIGGFIRVGDAMLQQGVV